MMAVTDYLEFEEVYLQTLGRGIRTLSVCAANSGEGVSTLAFALAERHQSRGRATLLVDMNLFKPSINQRFQLERTSWQAGQPSCSKAMVTVGSGLNVITASLGPVHGFRQMDVIQTMLELWLQHYDAVVIDTSPLNAINKHNIPAELVCACSQGTLMIVKTAVTRQEELQQAMNRLDAYQVNMLGVVMNDVEFPLLRTEVQRELQRLATALPRLSQKLMRWARSSHLLNIKV
jgi:protein-tyrosine kinase